MSKGKATSVEDIRKEMLADEKDADGDYMNRLKEVSGSGLVNTRISDRESEVSIFYVHTICANTFYLILTSCMNPTVPERQDEQGAVSQSRRCFCCIQFE